MKRNLCRQCTIDTINKKNIKNKQTNECCNSIHWKMNVMFGGGKPQWTVLQHNGPLFPPIYETHGKPVIVNGNEIILPELVEEYATMYAKFIDTPYMENNTFKKNFWKDFKKILPQTLNIQSLDQIDFTPIKNYLIMEKEKKSLLTKEEKDSIKKSQDEIDEPYKFCIIDGIQQQVGNYKIEPPGIFLGRGTHPKIGKIKKRIMPKDVIINLSKDAPIPEPNIPGHKWGDIIHDQSVIWLASWKDDITGKNKYIFTSLDSFFKSKSDESKFDLARQLKKKANIIREDYEKQLIDENPKNKQLATCLYFIDNLALRVGGSKDTKEEADTVGVTSLRVEHIILLEDNIVKLDFLGKDSVRYCRKIAVHSNIYKNLQEFMLNKSKKDDLFDLVTSSNLNEYLSSIMPGLTAKVWRTYNASLLFQKEIDKIKETKVSDPNERLNYLIAMFNQANTSVALLCNHQKTINASLDNMLKKIDDRLKELKQKKKKYQDNKDKDKASKIEIKIAILKLKKETKLKMKNVSLGTSKNNYIDPRIIFAFIKKFEIPPEKLFTKVLIKRFEWASKVDSNFKF
jgi:DNA topoisomerase-1